MTDKIYSAPEQANLDLVRTVYAQVLDPSDPALVDRYFAPDYIQHSPLAGPGPQGLKDFLVWAKNTTPHARHYLKRLFADGDFVIAHVHVVIEPDTPGNAVIDLFRIENGRIAEHWDVMQPVPETLSHHEGMF